ncbi:MAG TPA: 2-oxoacid:acceptor oxidoreductase family protein [Candidatus Deferrimicrobiaceae bacterium]|nr:2-oxoacid:acceptor oxidoreductase family protein [Candidatus Deferrimicrobiaceae bacterium]
MTTDVIMAGFGGQGILMIGNLLSLAAMEEGRNVTYFPAYGVEMRGGTANCTVVISDEEIGSPVVGFPKSCVIMNGPSLEKYLPLLQKGGNLIINRSLVDPANVTRGDLKILSIPANDIAREATGSPQLASMVALGAYVAATGVVRMQTLFDCLPKVVSKKYERFIPLNVNALKEGESFARNHP